MVVNQFIKSCRLLLHNGVVEHKIINGILTKCTNFENDKIRVVKSMIDYSMIIINKSSRKDVVCIDKDGYVSKIDSEWKTLI